MAQGDQTAVATQDPKAVAKQAVRDKYRHKIQASAEDMILGLLPPDKAREAAARVGLAFETAMRTAKDGGDAMQKCKPASVGACIARSALTNLFPGGPHPDVYLVPRGGELSWEITHRGIAKIAARAGYMLNAIPVFSHDEFAVDLNQLVAHKPNNRAKCTYDALEGVAVVVTSLTTGAVLCRTWVPRWVIDERKNSKQAGPVWNQWPIEMAQKTAIKYASARGSLPIRGDEWDMGVDAPEVIDTTAVESDAFGLSEGASSIELPAAES